MSVTQSLVARRPGRDNTSPFVTAKPRSVSNALPFVQRILRRGWPWSSDTTFKPNSSSSAILAVLLHEIRNPLGTIANAAQIMSNAPHADNIALARTMRSEVHRLQKLADTLGLLCCGPRPTRSRFDLGTALADLLVLVVHEPAFERGRRLITHIPDAPIKVRGDADQIQQVLWNLLLNACHHGEGPVTLQITQSRRHVQVSVINHCRPSAADEPTTSGRNRRMGLGLDISRFILQRHDSRLHMNKDNAQVECSFVLRRAHSLRS